jgi:hypothetical protein
MARPSCGWRRVERERVGTETEVCLGPVFPNLFGSGWRRGHSVLSGQRARGLLMARMSVAIHIKFEPLHELPDIGESCLKYGILCAVYVSSLGNQHSVHSVGFDGDIWHTLRSALNVGLSIRGSILYYCTINQNIWNCKMSSAVHWSHHRLW